jgi:hypothetical protein
LNVLTLITLALSLVSIHTVDTDLYYTQIVDQAHTNCKNRKAEKVDVSLLWKLVDIERHYKVPPSLQGMILSAACAESGYNPKAKGDRKFSKSKKKPMAIGLLQLWPIYEKMYPGLDRTDPIAAAHAWMKHIVRQIPKVKRKCKYKKERKIWVAAWVTGIRYYKPGGRCKEKPKHLRILRKWHRAIKKKNRESEKKKNH